MEIKNNTSYSEEAIKKYVSFSMHKGKYHQAHKIVFNTFWWIIMTIFCLSLILLALIEPSEIIELLPEIIIVVGLTLLIFGLLPRVSYKNAQKMIGSNVQFVFANDEYSIHSSSELAKSNGTYKYDFLFKAYETDNYFYLYVNKVAAYIVDKNGFEDTTPEEFSRFIESKLSPGSFIRCK